MESSVYFVQAGEGGPIKIGRAASPARRLVMLQTGNVAKLVLLAIAPGADPQERALHRKFSYARIRNEWFAPDHALLECIQYVLQHGVLPSLLIHDPALVNAASVPLLDAVNGFMGANNIPASTFGRIALGDPKFVSDIRSGRRVWPETETKVRAFIDAHSTQQGAAH